MEEATSLWIFELNVKTSCSRLSIGSKFLQPFADGNRFEQFLPVFQAQIQIRGNQIREMSGMLGVQRGDFDLIGQRGGHLGDFFKLLVRVAEHRLKFDGILGFVAQQIIAGAQIRHGRRKFFMRIRHSPSTSTRSGAVGKFHHFGQARNAADFVQIFGRRLGDFRFALQHRAEQTVARDNIVNQFETRSGFDEQRDDCAGKNHDVRKAEDGHGCPAANATKRAAEIRFFGRCRGC